MTYYTITLLGHFSASLLDHLGKDSPAERPLPGVDRGEADGEDKLREEIARDPRAGQPHRHGDAHHELQGELVHAQSAQAEGHHEDEADHGEHLLHGGHVGELGAGKVLKDLKGREKYVVGTIHMLAP